MKSLSQSLPQRCVGALACAFLATLATAPLSAQGHGYTLKRPAPWPATIVEIAESLPVQDSGRIKPLHTYARCAPPSAALTD